MSIWNSGKQERRANIQMGMTKYPPLNTMLGPKRLKATLRF
jgi:hypothetical protein